MMDAMQPGRLPRQSCLYNKAFNSTKQVLWPIHTAFFNAISHVLVVLIL